MKKLSYERLHEEIEKELKFSHQDDLVNWRIKEETAWVEGILESTCGNNKPAKQHLARKVAKELTKLFAQEVYCCYNDGIEPFPIYIIGGQIN